MIKRPFQPRKTSNRLRSTVRQFGLTALLFSVLVALIVHFENRASHVMQGRVVVSDGDSIRIDGDRIRLRGIDAPELDQQCLRGGASYACGIAARDRLRQLVDAKPVQCHVRRKDRYGRFLARCMTGDVDINRRMVEEGWAIAYGDYESAEAEARRARRGLWAGTFEKPQDWRMSKGLAVEDGGLWESIVTWVGDRFSFLY